MLPNSPTSKQFRVDSQRPSAHELSSSTSDQSSVNVAEFRASLMLRLGQSSTVEELTLGLNELLSEFRPCHQVWIHSGREPSQGVSPEDLDPEILDHCDLIREESVGLADQAISSNCVCHRAISTEKQLQLSAVSIDGSVQNADVICVISEATDPSGNAQWTNILSTVADQTAIWKHSRIHLTVQNQTKQIADAFNLSQAICKAERPEAACRSIVNHLRQVLGADYVAIALQNQNNAEYSLEAVSDVETIDKTSELCRIAELACRYAGNLDEPVLTTGDKSTDQPALPLQQLVQAVPSKLGIAAPIVTDAGDVLGSLVVTGCDSLASKTVQASLRRLLLITGNHLERTIEATKSPVKQLLTRSKKAIKDRRTRIAGICIALVALVLCVPMPYKIACDATIQPVVRRFVPAPYEGILASSLVEPGDMINKDQVLATMDGRQLRIELASVQAELSREVKRRDAALAAGNIADSQIAKHEIERLNSQIEILNNRLSNLTIRSPINGIVVTGDLAKAEGAPLEIGQNLYEIAPLDEMMVEIAIPESEIRFVDPSMIAEVKLEAYPYKTWEAEIERIYPSTEVIDGESVFIAEIRLPNELENLRPGMQGTVKIRSNWHPLGWNLFHHWWEDVRTWTSW